MFFFFFIKELSKGKSYNDYLLVFPLQILLNLIIYSFLLLQSNTTIKMCFSVSKIMFYQHVEAFIVFLIG